MPPHWGVDFWIRNLDEALSKATALGAKVIRGPNDIPDLGMGEVRSGSGGPATPQRSPALV